MARLLDIMSENDTAGPLRSIVLTLSQQTIADRRGGYRAILSEWANSDGENLTWWYKCGNAPKEPNQILYVYWVVKGRIRYRCRLLEVVKNTEMTFGTRTMFAKNWLVLFDFEPIPRDQQVTMKGFQGFRYYDQDL